MSFTLFDFETGRYRKALLIDDVRDIHGVTAIARTYESGIAMLQLFKWDILLLDHDLGAVEPQQVNGREATGYDILCWLEEHPDRLPDEIVLVTSNPAGRLKMQQVIDKLYGKRDDMV